MHAGTERHSRDGKHWTRHGWRLAGLLLTLLVFAVLPSPQVRLGEARLQGLVGSYLYAIGIQHPPVGNLRVTDIWMPLQIRVEWDYAPGTDYSFEVTWPGYSVTTKNTYAEGPLNVGFGSTGTVKVRVVPDNPYGGGLPAPPPGANAGDIYTYYTTSEWSQIGVVPAKADASENQTVDSRYDLRYGNPTFLNFQFGTRTYRGGLFVGNAADASRVGRSFFKATLPALPTGAHYWAGSLNAYYTRAATTGTTEVGAHVLNPLSTWSASLLTWSSAPSLDPTSPFATVDIAWNAASPQSSWVHWTANNQVEGALSAGGLLSAALASTNENSGGWVYFAKKEWDGTKAPCVLYAYEP